MTLEITQAGSLALGKTRGSLCKDSEMETQEEGRGQQPSAFLIPAFRLRAGVLE